MKILIDMQGAQSESRYRGIGRYARSLTRALVSHRRSHEIVILLNDNLRENLADLHDELRQVLPLENLIFFTFPSPCAAQQPENKWRSSVACMLRSDVVASVRPDVVLVTSMFEGFLDDAITSTSNNDCGAITATILYDLIPLTNRAAYLADPNYNAFYLSKIEELKKSNVLLPISESARREAIDLLDWAPNSADVILAGVDIKPSIGEKRLLLGIAPGAYLLHVGALDSRKNPEALIEAFSLLPGVTRRGLKIVFAGRLSDAECDHVRIACGRHGVRTDEVIFPGYVSEAELAILYSEAAAAIVPSLHEGFGLPALEAMACGCVVFAANSTSLPEVVDRADLLFDPRKPPELTALVERLLSDSRWRDDVKAWCLRRADSFTWKRTAERVLDSLERHFETRRPKFPSVAKFTKSKPTLAFVSPLPEARSGIASYSAELLPALSQFYKVVCIVAGGEKCNHDWISSNLEIHDIEWFKRCAVSFDRILYQMGNSSFHAHMLELLELFPGVTVLHDVHIGELLEYMSGTNLAPWQAFERELYRTHGAAGLLKKRDLGLRHVVQTAAMNDAVIRSSHAILVHSEDARRRILNTHGPSVAEIVKVQPQLHLLPVIMEKLEARSKLGIDLNEFVVCSFGFMNDNKLIPLIVEAWAHFRQSSSQTCRLIFVGEGNKNLIQDSAENAELGITVSGFVDDTTYNEYLFACDAAVQLRLHSRGETSRAVLDCLAAGVACIVNAHSSAAEIPDDCIIALPEVPTVADVSQSFSRLLQDREYKTMVGARGRALIELAHAPDVVASHMNKLIEKVYKTSSLSTETNVLHGVARLCKTLPFTIDDINNFSIRLALNKPRRSRPQLLCDVSVLAETGGNTGIQRVVRRIIDTLLSVEPSGWRVEPVIVDGQAIYARRFLAVHSNLPMFDVADEGVDARAGDVFLALDWNPDRLPRASDWLQEFRRRGGRVVSVVYDLLPLETPHFFPNWMEAFTWRWFQTVAANSDRIACISQVVANDVKRYKAAVPNCSANQTEVYSFELGADFVGSPLCGARTPGIDQIKQDVAAKFLMVGTVEPRKGHAQMLRVFEELWREKHEVVLVVVGKLGWMTEEVGISIRSNPNFGRRLFWYEDADDSLLDNLYAEVDVLIAASFGEGFGLPIIEAALKGVNVIARDIPVFREVGGRHAFYFANADDTAVVAAFKHWLELFKVGEVPSSRGMRHVDWAECTRQLMTIALD